MAETKNISNENYFEANFYDTKCICINSEDLLYNKTDKEVALGYDLLIKFKYTNKKWSIILFSINNTVNIKVFCENRNGKQTSKNTGVIRVDRISDFFKDLI
jgi:hypothetical protein